MSPKSSKRLLSGGALFPSGLGAKRSKVVIAMERDERKKEKKKRELETKKEKEKEKEKQKKEEEEKQKKEEEEKQKKEEEEKQKKEEEEEKKIKLNVETKLEQKIQIAQNVDEYKTSMGSCKTQEEKKLSEKIKKELKKALMCEIIKKIEDDHKKNGNGNGHGHACRRAFLSADWYRIQNGKNASGKVILAHSIFDAWSSMGVLEENVMNMVEDEPIFALWIKATNEFEKFEAIRNIMVMVDEINDDDESLRQWPLLM
jgi:flagellar biosynthesis GTPase FlhF